MQIVSNNNSSAPQLVVSGRDKDFAPVLVCDDFDVNIVIVEQLPDIQLIIDVYSA